jgi:glycosyltransferase involved in cell wall biosynthesis
MSSSPSRPYLSVVIPALNEDKFLPRLLKNLNNQSYRDFEVFVVDGNSQDSTAALTKSFPATYPLKLITTKKRHVSHQRNLGARRATGKVLVFFDADTQIPKNYLEKIAHIFEAKRPHMVTTYMKADSVKPAEVLYCALSNLLIEIGRIVKTPLAYGAAQAIKRPVFEDIGGFDETLNFAEDSELFQQGLNYNYKFIVIPKPAYTFSLRRLRAEGMVEIAYQYLKINLNIALKGRHQNDLEYEMGGGRYKYKKLQKPQFTRRFDKFFKQLSQRTAQQSAAVKDFIDRYSPNK